MEKDLVGEVARRVGVDEDIVSRVLDGLREVATEALQAKGTFEWSSMFAIDVLRKPALPAREGVNPFTKEPMTFRGRAAANEVHLRLSSDLEGALGAPQEAVPASGNEDLGGAWNLVHALARRLGEGSKSAPAVLTALEEVAIEILQSGHSFVWPGVVKIVWTRKPARPVREGINPFTKVPMTFSAKPAVDSVRAHVAPALHAALQLGEDEAEGDDE
jgi:nucleoid DNA-binding protein